jgi:hypothetical protein
MVQPLCNTGSILKKLKNRALPDLRGCLSHDGNQNIKEIIAFLCSLKHSVMAKMQRQLKYPPMNEWIKTMCNKHIKWDIIWPQKEGHSTILDNFNDSFYKIIFGSTGFYR